MSFGAETITRNQNKIIRVFDRNSAYKEESALKEDSFLCNEHISKRTLNNLIKEGVIVRGKNGLYLNKDEWNTFKKSLRRFFLV